MKSFKSIVSVLGFLACTPANSADKKPAPTYKCVFGVEVDDATKLVHVDKDGKRVPCSPAAKPLTLPEQPKPAAAAKPAAVAPKPKK